MKIHESSEVITIKTNNETDIVPMRSKGAMSVPVYHGVYEVTPNPFAEVELATEGKKMERNVVVDSIPYTEVSNPNGTTVIIGE